MNEKETLFNTLLIDFGKYYTLLWLIPLFIGSWNRKNLNYSVRFFLAFLLFTFLFNSVEVGFTWATSKYYAFFKPFLERWQIKNTLFLEILFYLRDYILLGLFYKELFNSLILKKIIWRISLGLSFFEIINYLYIDGYHDFGVFGPTFDAIYCFVLPAYFLWYNRNTETAMSSKKITYFWISIGLIVQNMFSLFFYYVADKLHDTDYVLYITGYIIKDCFDVLGLFFFCLAYTNSKYLKYVHLK